MASTNIIDAYTTFSCNGFQGAYVSVGQVYYVAVVAYACAVRRVIVITKDAQFLSPAYGNLASRLPHGHR